MTSAEKTSAETIGAETIGAVLMVLAKVPEPGAVKTQTFVAEGLFGFLLTRWNPAERPRRIRHRAGR